MKIFLLYVCVTSLGFTLDVVSFGIYALYYSRLFSWLFLLMCYVCISLFFVGHCDRIVSDLKVRMELNLGSWVFVSGVIVAMFDCFRDLNSCSSMFWLNELGDIFSMIIFLPRKVSILHSMSLYFNKELCTQWRTHHLPLIVSLIFTILSYSI